MTDYMRAPLAYQLRHKILKGVHQECCCTFRHISTFLSFSFSLHHPILVYHHTYQYVYAIR